jgi:hypothetical protein
MDGRSLLGLQQLFPHTPPCDDSGYSPFITCSGSCISYKEKRRSPKSALPGEIYYRHGLRQYDRQRPIRARPISAPGIALNAMITPRFQSDIVVVQRPRTSTGTLSGWVSRASTDQYGHNNASSSAPSSGLLQCRFINKGPC